jgi:hypothetical protein
MPKSTKEDSVSTSSVRRPSSRVLGFSTLLLVVSASACVTVRPEKRAVLADPIMQFQGDARDAAQRQHVIENREGSFGGSSVKGGGCGCN